MRVRVLLVVVVAFVAAGLLWSSRTGAGGPPTPATEPANVTEPEPEPVLVAATPPEPSQQREQVEATTVPAPAPDQAFDPSPVHVTPWFANFVVVDEDDNPLADAVVTIWCARKQPVPARMAKQMGFDKNYAYSGRTGEPLVELPVDTTGRAQHTLALECVVANAAKDGRSSGDYTLWHSAAANKETRLVVQTPVVLRGVIKQADGGPAIGAKVTAHRNGVSTGNPYRGDAAKPAPTTADANGRFELQVSRGFGYGIRAELGDARTFSEHVWILNATPPEVTLTFPGAITLAGVVLDPEGQPVANAEVKVWREYRPGDLDQDADDYETASTETGTDGRFSVAVRRHARYQLIAAHKKNANSEPTWTETTAARPHAEVRLNLQRFAIVRGRVVHEDGSPFAEVQVWAKPEGGQPGNLVPDKSSLFASVKAQRTDAEGAFEFAIHPATTWTIAVIPSASNYRLRVERAGVAPGTTDLEIRCSDADLAGCVVEGTVGRADGQELDGYQVEIINFEDGKQHSSSNAQATIEGNRFTLPPLPVGKQFAILVSAQGDRGKLTGPLAPAQTPPFVTTGAKMTVALRLEAWGKVPVRVVAADGTPPRGALVIIAPRVVVGFYPSAMPLDSQGTRLQEMVAPGEHDLRVFLGDVKWYEQELHVTPGLNPEVVVRLPATPPVDKR